MARLSQVFVPRDREFFDLFEEAAGNIVRAAGLLKEMLIDYPDKADLVREILICEQDGDRITHEIIQRINQTFVTPIDREDILALGVRARRRRRLHRGGRRLLRPLQDRGADGAGGAARRRARAGLPPGRSRRVPRLRELKDISHHTVEIHRLENDGDRITREAMASLFDGGIDPMVVIRWKDIYEKLENAIDATEKVANILETIAIKNS